MATKTVIEKIQVHLGDITTLTVDAIVNAANTGLRGGGGVDGAIWQAAGTAEMTKACRAIAADAAQKGQLPCPTGQVRITPGFRLPARYIFHTAGPTSENSELLASCYKNCLDLLITVQARSIAFPCISTGVYGYPNLSAAKVRSLFAQVKRRYHISTEDANIYRNLLKNENNSVGSV